MESSFILYTCLKVVWNNPEGRGYMGDFKFSRVIKQIVWFKRFDELYNALVWKEGMISRPLRFCDWFGRRQAPPALQRSSKTGRNTRKKAQSASLIIQRSTYFNVLTTTMMTTTTDSAILRFRFFGCLLTIIVREPVGLWNFQRYLRLDEHVYFVMMFFVCQI